MPAIACEVSRGAYEHEVLMCSHGDFPLGIFIKSTIYVYRMTFSAVIRTFVREGGGALIGNGRLLNIFSPGRGTYSKGDSYLKLGANSSIYGNSIKWSPLF